MSALRKGDVLAIFCSDIHLSDRPPIARSAEPDWFSAMRMVLSELKRVCGMLEAPLVIAGDIFDKPTPSIELVNFALVNLPKCYAVPGQHDLLHHSYENIRKTAYWTLVGAGVITNLYPNAPYMCDDVILHGFPWGVPLTQLKQRGARVVDIAVVHHFCWSKKSTKYEGASEESNVSILARKLNGFDIAVFGDNHKPFEWAGSPTIFNCGGLMRRTVKEVSHQPRVGLLMSDYSFISYELDCSKDKFADINEANNLVDTALDLTGMVHSLREMRDKGLNFVEALKQFCESNEVGKSIVRQILEAVGKEQK